MGTQGTTKVVFLIDRNCGSQDENAFAVIKLAVLKLLTHFSCRDGTVNEKRRWGYRIFDSTKECQMYKKRAIWLQYKYKHFQDFEEHLDENVPPERVKTRSKTTAHHYDHNGSCSEDRSSGPPRLPAANKQASDGDQAPAVHATSAGFGNIADADEGGEDTSSAYALRFALQDVMHDFQWEEPDMCSPMKSSRARSRHRRKKRENPRHASRIQSSAMISDGRQKHRRKEKMIFLAMRCPPSMKTLEEFVGDATKLNSAFSLRDTIVTKEFIANFCGEQNGSIFWLNTNMIPPGKPTLGLLNGMLSHMGGQVISLGWLMSNGSHLTSCLHSLQATQQALQDKTASKIGKSEEDQEKGENDHPEKKIPVPRNLLPLSIIIDHFLRSNVVSQPGMGDINHSYKETFQAVLCSNTGDATPKHCVLRMMPMFTSKSDCAPESLLNPGSSETFVIHNTEEIRTTKRKMTRNQSSNSIEQASTNQRKAFSLETGEQNASQAQSNSATGEQSPEARTVTIRTKIDQRQFDLGAFDSSSTYSCIGYDLMKRNSDDDDTRKVRNDGQLSKWFQEAMMNLSHQRMSLIIELSSISSSLTTLGVLEPLTPAMASIRLLHPKSIMPLATTLAFQSIPVSTGKGPALTSKVKRIVEKSAEAIMGCGRADLHSSKKVTENKDTSSATETDTGIPDELSCIDRGHHEPFHASWLEPWHISAPSRNTCDQVVEQLWSFPDDKRSPGIRKRQLVAVYEAFFKQLDNTMKGTTEVTSPLSNPAPGEQSKNAKDPAAVRQSPRLKRMKSTPSYVGARTANIMANSRKLQASKPKVVVKDKKSTILTKKKSDPIPVKLPDVSSVEDLTKHLKQSYQDVLTQNSCPLRFTQSTVAIVLHFYKTSQQTNQENSISNMRTLITDTLLLTNKELRERYAQCSNDSGDQEIRFHEVEMQTLLRLEMESVEPSDIAALKDKEKKEKEEKDEEDEDDDGIELPEALQDSVDEVVHLLETVPIFASADKLTALLTDVVLANYAETIPYMVRAIYEGLVKPVPSVLFSPSSDTTGVPSHKQPASYRSVSSGGSLNTLGSNSNRSRALVRHPSIADAAPKRIIGVPARRMQNEKKKNDAAEKKKKEQDNAAKTVKRNLFNDDSPDVSMLTRRNSVAVMQTHTVRRSPRKSVRSGQIVLKTKVVKETPGKKQVLKAMLNKLDRARRRSNSKERGTPDPSNMLVIEESPEKPVSSIKPDVRRSPRVHSLKRRPSFYKKQEMHRAKLLGARIAGTSPPAVALKEPPLSEEKTEHTKIKLSPASFLLSAITSPISKAPDVTNSPARVDFDSPSRNTRSRTGATPVKALGDSPGRSAPRVTPRAKARRRLNDELLKDDAKKSPVKDLSAITSSLPETPCKKQVEEICSGHRQSPRLLKKGGSGDKEGDIRGDSSAFHDEAMKTATRHSPRKAFRKIPFGSARDTSQLKDIINPDQIGRGAELLDGATGKESSSQYSANESPYQVKLDKIEKNDAKGINVCGIHEGEPSQATWFDKLVEGSGDKEQEMDQGNVIEHKVRSTPCKEDLGTPPIKRRRSRRDTCTPPYVPASKCATPEIINSWPRKKVRYNTPSPCTSKVLSSCEISPITKVEDIVSNLTSPCTRRRTPQSSSKQSRSGSGRKRKRQSPGVTSSEKKQRRSSGRSKNSPRAKGSLLSMLSPKHNLEQRCVSPVFGKALTRTTSNPQKLSKPSGSKGSMSSGESLDDLDKSFSPIFGKSLVTSPNVPSKTNGKDTIQQGLPMSFIDKGLDSDEDTDSEIDFPKLKSSQGSVGNLSDLEMASMVDRAAELTSENEKADRLSKEHLQKSMHEDENIGDSSHKKLRKRNSSQMSPDQKPLVKRHSSSSHDKIIVERQFSDDKLLESSNVGKALRKKRSSEKQEPASKLKENITGEETEVKDPKPALPSSVERLPDEKLLEDLENTRPKAPPKKKKRVTLQTRISSSLGQRQSTPSRLSMTLKRPSAGANWTVTNSPELASLMGASEDFSLTASSLSSADDDVFEQSSMVAGPSPPDVSSTPPTQSGKPSFVTTPLSTTGLYSLMNSPLVASGNRRSTTGTPKRGRTSRTSRRNLPLQ
ncbi:uncharacterized protein LOC121415640 [Lytechinus variegatus]|uniref:uncharacterized protein LOC121415640 n=1 Tax=Lytechinus variegatus TaxID=7654 RepID=UPI001BB24407|nr:uncharacterized protein LOC121415640 [Lytechinus variegatus]